MDLVEEIERLLDEPDSRAVADASIATGGDPSSSTTCLGLPAIAIETTAPHKSKKAEKLTVKQYIVKSTHFKIHAAKKDNTCSLCQYDGEPEDLRGHVSAHFVRHFCLCEYPY